MNVRQTPRRVLLTGRNALNMLKSSAHAFGVGGKNSLAPGSHDMITMGLMCIEWLLASLELGVRSCYCGATGVCLCFVTE